MIKAQEAKNITRSVELSEEILNKISIAIITAASKGEYSVDIFPILYPLCPDNYITYLKELGYEVETKQFGKYGIFLSWGGKI